MSELSELDKALIDLRLMAPAIDKVVQAELICLQSHAAELQAEKEQAEAKLAKMREGLESVSDLIDSSSGVYGLHLNGDLSPWEELLEGRQFEDWLIKFCEARDLLREE